MVSFVVLWIIGGACLDIVHGKDCKANGLLSGARNIPLVQYVLPVDVWSSLMFFVAPIAGFVLAFMLIRWWNEYFDTTQACGIWFPIILLIVLFVGYYVNLNFYLGEAAALNSRGDVHVSLSLCLAEVDSATCQANVSRINQELITQAQSSGATKVTQYLPVAYWSELRRSMFLWFVLGALCGWVPLFVREYFHAKRS